MGKKAGFDGDRLFDISSVCLDDLVSVPPTPIAGQVELFIKNDELCVLNSSAVETCVTAPDADQVNFDSAITDLVSRQDRLAQSIEPVLETIVETTPTARLRANALKLLTEGQIVETLPQAKRQLENFFTSIKQKFGDTLSAREVGRIQRVMNGRTKAFGEESFKQDTANIIADAARSRIDKLSPSKNVKNANAEWGRLQNLKKTMEIFNNKRVKIGNIGEALGRWTGVVTLAATGAGAVTGGVGGLVVAGLAAKFGGDAFAQFLRSAKFSKKAKELVVQAVKRDEEIVEKLIQEASVANKAVLERLLLPGGSIPLRPKTGKSGVEVVPAKKGLVGIDVKTGRFKKTFTSEGKNN